MNKFLIRFFTLVCAVITYFISGIIFFPNEIKLMDGAVRDFNFMLPVEASIEYGPEYESVNVLNVDGEPITGNISVSSQNNSLSLLPQGSGKAKMNVSAFGVPLKNVILDILPETEVVPWGATVGVRINTDGMLVVGTGYVTDAEGNSHNPCEGLLKSGDLILEVNGMTAETKLEFGELIKNANGAIKMKINRNGEILETSVEPVKGGDDGKNQIGLWIRNGTQGIGTITYFNPDSKIFAALGHGIVDIDTKKLMEIKGGTIMSSDVATIKKGKKGTPGELVGDIHNSEALGQIKKNTDYGIYGVIDNESDVLPQEKLKIALQDKVHEGPAKIRSNVSKDIIKEYDVYIESVNRYSSDDSKGMIVKITDPELLEATNGIVQGMSGSPIIQDNSLIGAVTHVFVQDPTKGYGIFIENMLKQEKSI